MPTSTSLNHLKPKLKFQLARSGRGGWRLLDIKAISGIVKKKFVYLECHRKVAYILAKVFLRCPESKSGKFYKRRTTMRYYARL